MKVYFLGTFSGGRKYVSNYQQIVCSIEKLGHDVLSKQIAEASLSTLGENKSSSHIYLREKEKIELCDAVVAETSVTGVGVGFFIHYALSIGKPVLVLNSKNLDIRTSIVLEGNSAQNLYLNHYTEDNLEPVLKNYLDHICLDKLAKFKGKFVVLEGTDGTGKSTQFDLLLQYLSRNGKIVSPIKFPRYDKSFYGRMVKRYLNGEFGSHQDADPYMIAMFYAMDRAQAKDEIYQSLKKGKLVLADRYTWSNMAFRSASVEKKKREEFISWMEEAEYNVNKIPKEDVVVLLYAPVEFTWKQMEKSRSGRKYTKKKRDVHEADKKYLKSVEKQYLYLVKRNLERTVVVKCVKRGKLRSVEDIHMEIVQKLREKGFI